jgi:membrane-bound serine protease (ClpP class)
MHASVELLVILLAAGLVMIGAEIFVPGGILGILGAVSLAGAIAVAFSMSAGWGLYVALGVAVLVGVTVVLWIRLFPRSPIGRRMTLSDDGRSFKSYDDGLGSMVGAEGVALSELRPAGFAMIGNQKTDVVSEGGMIAKGQKVRVIKVSGGRIVVRAVDEEPKP